MSIKELEKKHCVDIMIASKNRITELCLCLQSLQHQTFKNFNIFILDDASDVQYDTQHTFMSLINHMKQEGFNILLFRNNIQNLGVCGARNHLIEKCNMFNKGNIRGRIDDDVILSNDYVERLVKVIEKGYDMSSGVTPYMLLPSVVRRTEFVKPIINDIEVTENGDLLNLRDDCGAMFYDDEVIPAKHLRSCFFYKSEVNDSVMYEKGLSMTGFREETFFCLKSAFNGFNKMAVDTKAVAYHIQHPAGGCRDKMQQEQYTKNVNADHDKFLKWLKRTWLLKGDPFNNLKGDKIK